MRNEYPGLLQDEGFLYRQDSKANAGIWEGNGEWERMKEILDLGFQIYDWGIGNCD